MDKKGVEDGQSRSGAEISIRLWLQMPALEENGPARRRALPAESYDLVHGRDPYGLHTGILPRVVFRARLIAANGRSPGYRTANPPDRGSLQPFCCSRSVTDKPSAALKKHAVLTASCAATARKSAVGRRVLAARVEQKNGMQRKNRLAWTPP